MDRNLPVLLLKKLSLLPTQEVRLELNNDLSKNIVDIASKNFDKKLIVILPVNSLEEQPTITDLPLVGVIAIVKSCITLPSGNYRVTLKGLNRIKINRYTNYKNDKSVLIANVKRIFIDPGETVEEKALKKKLISMVKKYIDASPEVSNSILSRISDNKTLDELTDIIVNFLHFPIEKKLIYMNEFDEVVRARTLLEDLNIELEIMSLNNKIDNEMHDAFEREQKEYIIKEKIEKLQSEIGIKSTKDQELEEYQNKINKLKVDEKTKIKLETELKRYEYTPSNNPEISVIRNYLDKLLSVPFNSESKEEANEEKITKSLNKTHYKMDNVKRRIVEYAILKEKNPDLDNPIICLVGSPGVGKSTIASSIASALKREFYKISVGGLNDSSELVGHTRTYLGATPGKIMDAIIKCGTNNPVILIDEVDKMVKDFKGDPASTLLDILDNKQNQKFIDNYLEEPFDLSKVLFILTANDIQSIPAVLKDRLEIITIPNYSIFDKNDIATNYLIPAILKKYGVKKVNISDEIILEIIKKYTNESGVRELERLLDELIRYLIINKPKDDIDLISILGSPKIETVRKENLVGEVNIIGVSSIGGVVIKVSSIMVPMMYDSCITGNIGESLKDSIKVVQSFLKSNNYLDYKKTTYGTHIHFDTSKFVLDGKSGSLGVAMSLVSVFNNKQIESDIAFIGDLDLFGRINKVSRLRDKLITAYNNGIKTVFVPLDNKIDEALIPDEILKNLTILYIQDFDEVYKLLIKKK